MNVGSCGSSSDEGKVYQHQSAPLAVLPKLHDPIGSLSENTLQEDSGFIQYELPSSKLDLVSCFMNTCGHTYLHAHARTKAIAHAHLHTHARAHTHNVKFTFIHKSLFSMHEYTRASDHAYVRKILVLKKSATSDTTVAMA